MLPVYVLFSNCLISRRGSQLPYLFKLYLWGVLVAIDELLQSSTRCYMARSVADAASLKKGAKDKDCDNMTVTTAAPAEDSKSVGEWSWNKPSDMRAYLGFGPGEGSGSSNDDVDSQPDVTNDGMESHASSKHSKARSSKERGPNRRAKAKARLAKHLESQGKTYDPLLREKNASASMLVKGTMATAIQTKMIENTAEETEDEKTKKMEQQLLAENSLLAQVPQSQERWISMKDGEPYCQLCKKFGQMHIESKPHILRVEEDAILTAMSGTAGTTRRFSGSNGYQGPATKKALLNHYGDALMSLPAEVAKRHPSKSM